MLFLCKDGPLGALLSHSAGVRAATVESKAGGRGFLDARLGFRPYGHQDVLPGAVSGW